MSRGYVHIKRYEREIIEEVNKGRSLREIGEKYGFTYKQMRDFKTRYNQHQRAISAGIPMKPKGRPRKEGTEIPPSIQQLSTVAQLRYEITRKENRIKRLEMENELMRDFLSLTERK